MPLMGYGTFLSSDQEKAYEETKHAIINCGYRHIDTASLYGNEEAIGRAIKDAIASGIKREDLFIVTKLWRDDYNDPAPALQASLDRLGLEYVDLYLIHWTFPKFDYESNPPKALTPSLEKIWEVMETLVDAGKTKHIGVSNATCMALANLLANCRIRPANNQIELHPFNQQEEFVKF